jgi:hypothetical protein
MGFVVAGVVGGMELMTAAARDLATVTLVPLRQGLMLLPMTAALFDEVENTAADADELGFWKLPGGFEGTLLAWSAGGPVAYIEAEYFGGTGTQRAAVWASSALILGPIGTREREPFPEAGSPISQALRALGASADGSVDEFEAVGLDTHRRAYDWV